MATKIVVLNSFEEEEVLRRLKKNALKQCDEFVREFNDCCIGKALTLPILCRKSNKKMQDCLKRYTGDNTRDIYREERLKEKTEKLKMDGFI